MSGLFESLAFDEEVHRVAARKALALARARATKRFAQFLANGNHDERLALVAGDLTETVKQACADVYYDDWESVLASVKQHLGFTVEARKPKMCPVHREITDISLQQGDPQAGFAAMAQHMFSENSCRGAWEGGRCNFKPEMTTQSYWDTKAEKAEERRLERERMRAENEHDWDNEGGGQPHPDAEPEPVTDPVATPDDIQVPEPDAPIETDLYTDSDWAMAGDAERDMVMARTGEALKTVDVDQGGAGPSPKMDKKKWTPENVRFLDVEMSGSPHPTRHQDIAEPAAYKSSDPGDDDGRLEQTRAVTETQDVEKDSNPTDGGGAHTETFGGGGRSAVSATQVNPRTMHPGSILPLSQIEQNIPGLSVNGMPFAQFEQSWPQYIGQPLSVEHATNPQMEQVAAQCLEQASGSPLRDFMAIKAHNKGKHEGMMMDDGRPGKKGCPLCEQGQVGQGAGAGPPQTQVPGPGGMESPVDPNRMSATDPDKNPITEFLTDEQEAQALAEWRDS